MATAITPSPSFTTLSPVDKKNAKKAISRRALKLRELMEDENNTDVFVQAGLLSTDKSDDVIEELQTRVAQNPELFRMLVPLVKQLATLHVDTSLTDVADKLQESCSCDVPDDLYEQVSSLINQHRVPLMISLKKKLRTLNDLNADSQKIKHVIADTIHCCSIDNIDIIKNGLPKMKEDGYFSSKVLEWAFTEIQEYHRLLAAQEEDDNTAVYPESKQIELDKNLLYHSSLCCMAVNNYDTAGCVKLLQSLSRKSLTKLSISQCHGGKKFPKCLIAKNADKTYFVAFESYLDFRFWDKLDTHVAHCTFGKVLESVIADLPTLFFENIIKEGRMLILTGFSFGGVLAHILAAKLWKLPWIYSDQLISNVICVTFAQPFIQSELINSVAETFPDFLQNVHALRIQNDSIPFVLGKLEAITCSDRAMFPSIVENLSLIQNAGIPTSTDSTANLQESSMKLESQSDATDVHRSKTHQVAEKELKELIEQSSFPNPNPNLVLPQTNYTVISTDGRLKFVEETAGNLNARASYIITAENFQLYTVGAYHMYVKRFTQDDLEIQNPRSRFGVVTDQFLLPAIDGVKVTYYGNEATVVVMGKQLWFTHSLTLSSTLKNPIQVQKEFVSFNAETCDLQIAKNGEEKEVTLYSYFSLPITKKVYVEFDPNQLSPRGRQLARLEPVRLIELAFMMALLEKQQVRLDGSSVGHGELSPLFSSIKQFLHQIATVVPYESILCAIAYSSHKETVAHCITLIKTLNVEFPFSLTMFASVIVALTRMHGVNNFEQPKEVRCPFEDYAYYLWLATKLLSTKINNLIEASMQMQQNQQSDGNDSQFPFTDFSKTFSQQISFPLLSANPLLIIDESSENENLVYMQKMAQNALKQHNIDKATALSDKSAVELYKFQHKNLSLKSPIQALVEGRDKLHELSTSSIGQRSLSSNANQAMIKVLKDARGAQFDLCVAVTCGFMYQHVRVPFTEENPVTVWKSIRLSLGTIWDSFSSPKSPTTAMQSMTYRCEKVISKGTDVADKMYDGKLHFLVSHIDPVAAADAPTPSSDYSVYTLEHKLKELCSERRITKDTNIDDIVSTWRSHFEHSDPKVSERKRKRKRQRTYHLLDVAKSHRTLIARWIKWSLMVNDLRAQLEKYTTIAVAGLVNSGKTQLMRNLFGLDVKAGTTELRRTTVPFIYSLSPDVEGINVIDFPGADDSDRDVLQVVEFLKFISQIVIFVVNYDKAHTKATKELLQKFEVDLGGNKEELDAMANNPRRLISNVNFEKQKQQDCEKVPVLVCMTHADRFLAELMEEEYTPAQCSKKIASHFESTARNTFKQDVWNPVNRRTIGYYCFDLSRSIFSVSDMASAEIKLPCHVGEWLCNQVKNELHMSDAAKQLETYFSRSCNTTLK